MQNVSTPEPHGGPAEQRADLPAPRPVLWPLRSVDSAGITDEIMRDGQRVITIRHVDLDGVTPEMLAWWYRHVVGDMFYAGSIWPRYLVWHPLDHISYQVLDPLASGGVTLGARIHIREAFQRDPHNVLDIVVEVESFAPDTAVIHKQIAGARVMRLINEFHPTPRGSRYITRMEIGASGLPGSMGLNAVIRRRILPGAKARAWARHHVEEIGNLQNFLPQLWAAQVGAARG
jgi:hypothetical protein